MALTNKKSDIKQNSAQRQLLIDSPKTVTHAKSSAKTIDNDSRRSPLSRSKTVAHSIPSKTSKTSAPEMMKQATNNVKTVTKPVLSVKKKKQKEILKRQIKLLKDKEVRAVPDGYYTGLINDMHKDHANFIRKGTFLQMEYLTPLLQEAKQTAQLIDRFNEETRLEERKIEKSKAPMAFNALAIQCSLPSKYDELENLSPVSFLVNYAKPLVNRQQVALKSIRKIQRDPVLDVMDAKDVVFDYFNQYKTHQEIDDLFNSLEIISTQMLEPKEVVIICCYAERYFLHQLAKTEIVAFERALQEVVDFEFLLRKFDGLKLSDGLRRLIRTILPPDEDHLRMPAGSSVITGF